MIALVIDIETTGFNKELDDILELGCITIDVETLKILNSGQLFFYNSSFLLGNEDANNIHRLTEEFLQQFEPFLLGNSSEMMARLFNSYIVGKNCKSFDYPFLVRWLRRILGKGIKDLHINGCIDIQNYMGKYYRNYKASIGEEVSSRRTGKLEEYLPVIGVTMGDIKSEYVKLNRNKERPADDDMHSALFDCYVTYKCLVWLYNQGENLTFDSLPPIY